MTWSAPVRAARVVLPFLVALLENNTVRFVCVHLARGGIQTFTDIDANNS